jgi:hypothetical protein
MRVLFLEGLAKEWPTSCAGTKRSHVLSHLLDGNSGNSGNSYGSQLLEGVEAAIRVYQEAAYLPLPPSNFIPSICKIQPPVLYT